MILIGKMVKYEYPSGAISCCMSGVTIKGSGIIRKIYKRNVNDIFGSGTLLVDDQLIRPSEIKYILINSRWHKYTRKDIL